MILLRTGQILVSDGVREKEIEGVIEREKDLLKVPGYHCMANSPAHAHTHSQDKTPFPVTRCRRVTG